MQGPEMLGHTFQDKITGFTGVANGFCYYISGCHQVLLSTKCKEDGSFVNGVWFDAQRLIHISGTAQVVLDNSKTPGFDQSPLKQ